jgi:enterochelin esterase-like enzyme
MDFRDNVQEVLPVSCTLHSSFLERSVRYDVYLPEKGLSDRCPILLVNDGQDLVTMSFETILQSLWGEQLIGQVLVVAIHAGTQRRMEYGTVGEPDYLGRGAKAGLYRNFILEELLPVVHAQYPATIGAEIGVAGFSLGGLSAMDLVWRHPDIFHTAGIFSGSFWWRCLSQEHPFYSDGKHRIMHNRVRNRVLGRSPRFFFQCGALDEPNDRNRNGIIDSIDDTLDLIEELVKKGVPRATHIYYLELADGKHDVASWARAFPFFLRWNYGQ